MKFFYLHCIDNFVDFTFRIVFEQWNLEDEDKPSDLEPWKAYFTKEHFVHISLWLIGRNHNLSECMPIDAPEDAGGQGPDSCRSSTVV